MLVMVAELDGPFFHFCVFVVCVFVTFPNFAVFLLVSFLDSFGVCTFFFSFLWLLLGLDWECGQVCL